MYAAAAVLSSSSVSSAAGALRLRMAPAREMVGAASSPRAFLSLGKIRPPVLPSSLSICSCSTSSAGSVADEEVPQAKPWLFVGLGNPGKMYDGTRHNVGFEMVDMIARSEGISLNSMRSKALFGRGQIGKATVMFAKPQTFMNASGESVANLVAYFKVPLNQVVVIYDDLDLPFASLKLLPKGGHGGHNGMRSVIHHFKGVKEFPRLRIGIGRPPGKMEARSFVLKPFNKKEIEELSLMYQTGLEAARTLVRDGFDKSATFVNSAKTARLLS